MTKDEIVSELVRRARAENRTVCFYQQGKRAMRGFHRLRMDFATLEEKAQAAIERHYAARCAYMLCASSAKEELTLREVETSFRNYCAQSCTQWAAETDRSPRNLDYFDAELRARREALHIVVQENLRANAAAKQEEAA